MSTFKEIFKQHPTLLLTVCYFLITAIGIVYSYLFYREFEINILKFADLSDFLLASILEPRTLVVFIAMVVFTLACYWIDNWFRRKFPRYDSFNEKVFKAKSTDPIAFIFIVLAATYVLLDKLAIRNANFIKQDQTNTEQTRGANNISDNMSLDIRDRFSVKFGEFTSQPQHLILLGSSSRYAYLYHQELKQSWVVPVENIAVLVKQMSNIEQVKITQNAEKPLEKLLIEPVN
jgi:hypothetical protein